MSPRLSCLKFSASLGEQAHTGQLCEDNVCMLRRCYPAVGIWRAKAYSGPAYSPVVAGSQLDSTLLTCGRSAVWHGTWGPIPYWQVLCALLRCFVSLSIGAWSSAALFLVGLSRFCAYGPRLTPFFTLSARRIPCALISGVHSVRRQHRPPVPTAPVHSMAYSSNVPQLPEEQPSATTLALQPLRHQTRPLATSAQLALFRALAVVPYSQHLPQPGSLAAHRRNATKSPPSLPPSLTLISDAPCSLSIPPPTPPAELSSSCFPFCFTDAQLHAVLRRACCAAAGVQVLHHHHHHYEKQHQRSTRGYVPAVRFSCVQVKVHGKEPEDLPTHFTERLRQLACTRGCVISGVYIRRGCIELTLDIENSNYDGRRAGGGDGSGGGGSDSGGEGADDGCGALRVGSAGGRLMESASRTVSPPDADPDAAATVPCPLEFGSGVETAAADGHDVSVAAVIAAGMGGMEQKQRWEVCSRGGAGGESGGRGECHLDLGTSDGALALAQRVHAAVGGRREALVSGGSSVTSPPREELLLTTATAAAVAVPPQPGHSQERRVATADPDPKSLPLPKPSPAVRAVMVGEPSFSSPPRGPAISRVHPRVVTVMHGDRQCPAAPPYVALVASAAAIHGSGGDVGAIAGSPQAASHQDDTAAAAAAQLPADSQRGNPARFITLYVEISAPQHVSLRDLTSQATTGPATVAEGTSAASSAAVAAVGTATATAAVAPAGAPVSVELLLRCSSRYIPLDIQPALPLTEERTRKAVPVTSAAGVMSSADGGAAAAATVTHAYRITLLEDPPASGGVMLVDLRWQGRPAQVVPVVLLDKLDEQLLTELSTVAATWTGPPQELDGLLYDCGAWMRCMSPLRWASGTPVRGLLAAGSGCAAVAATARGVETPHALTAAASAAAAVASGSGGGNVSARSRPPYLPVLGASLLQFAHAHGLMGMAARLQMDMRGCGYTAPFRPLLHGRVPPSGPVIQLQPPSSLLTLPAGEPLIALPVVAVVAAPSRAFVVHPATAAAAAPPAAATVTNAAGAGVPAHSKTRAPELPEQEAPPRHQAGRLCKTAAAAGVRYWRSVSEVLSWSLCFRRRRDGSPTAVATAAAAKEEEEAYQAFMESYGAVTTCLLHLLDILSSLGLLAHLLASRATSDQRVGGGGTPLLIFLVLTSLPAALTGAAWLLLPPLAWRRIAPCARLVRHLSQAAGRLLWLSGIMKCLPSSSSSAAVTSSSSVHQGGYRLGPGALVMEGVVVPAACLLPPWAALLIAVIKLLLYAVASHAAATATAAAAVAATAMPTAAAASYTTQNVACTAAMRSRWDSGFGVSGAGVLFAESVFRALAVTATALVTMLACHVNRRLRFQRLRKEVARKNMAPCSGAARAVGLGQS